MKAPIPMEALYERIDSVRSTSPQLGQQLFRIAAEMPSSRTSRKLKRLSQAIESDRSTPSVVSAFPDLCWVLTMQSSSATANALTEALEQAAYQTVVRNKRLRAIVYPSFMFVLASVMVLFGCALIVPTFDEMYTDFQIRLPPQTALLLSFSRFVTGQPVLAGVLVGIGAVMISAVVWFWTSDNLLKMALIGRSGKGAIARQSLAKAAVQIAELIDDGVAFERAMRIAAESNGDPSVQGALADLAMTSRNNPKKLKHTRVYQYLPGNFMYALDVQSPTGAPQPNTELLRQLAASYQDLSVQRKDWASFLIGHGALIFVGLCIGYIIFSLFAPMFSLIVGLSG